MTLLDTSIWIDFLRGKQPTAYEARRLLEDGEATACEAVFGELLQGAKGVREERIVLGYWSSIPHADEEGLWLEAGKLSAKLGLHARGVGLIDATIFAYALRHDLQLWTHDRKLGRLAAELAPRNVFTPK